MNLFKFVSICRLFDKISRTQSTNDKVDKIKQSAINRIDQATMTAQDTAARQSKIMAKTATYYIGKATGAIK